MRRAIQKARGEMPKGRDIYREFFESYAQRIHEQRLARLAERIKRLLS
jgi:hypothetical protein